ncbi:hypothetical protein GCM10023347_00820 [Streptomyces chumphonensis]|uniref:Uncharacterized protein n=1 Tax=Streptomyces chumphonensis TaxID=1214925 RepID=A0A927F4Y0_9ACTN|nr:hypothetical protein [Streptomyces chumphonensis]MBD3934371.1 hypothetical protein [Streptomyces chumphonensis]
MYPQQPQHPPIAPVPYPPAPPRKRTGLVLAALAAGLVLGAGAVGTVWAVVANDTPSDARADAEAACGALDRFDPDLLLDEGPDGLTHNYRWSSAMTLAQGAAEADARYRPLAERLLKARDAFHREFELSGEAMDHLDEARRLCAEL